MCIFCNLHVHTEYSLLDGMSNTEAIVKRAKALGQTAIAKTDHGVMYGTKNFVDDANKHGIKPIVGVEAYLSPHSLYDKGKDDKKPFHQLLHAQTLAGYKNLMRLSHIASTDGFYYKPRIDKETLAKYSEGLIATSGCTSSIIPKTLDNPIRLATEMDYWMSVFGKDRFYIELQPNQYHNAINQQLIELAKRYGLHTIVTTDSHYTSPDDYNAHDTMLCIQTNRDKRAKPTEKDLYFSENMYYLMSEDEILRHFDQSHFLGNAILAESVEPLDLSRKHYHIPQYELPSGFESPNDFLRELALSNIENMYPQNVAEARQRLEFELDIIQKTGFADYFLLVWDLCMYTSHVGVLHNVRGSGAGSVTCYLLGITSVDPIENGLLFERFLNPSRVTMPDIDIDYPDSKRQVVIDYLVSRYGVNNVSAIVTFGTMGAKMSIKDVGRAYGMSVADTNAITKQMDSGQKATLDYYYDNVPDFRTRYHNDKHFKTMWDESLQLEGKVRSAGTHPAGIIVTPTPVYNYVALDRATGSSVATRTQEDMEVCEALGLLKIDVLGLSTLTVVHHILDMVRKRYGVNLDIKSIPYRHTDDSKSNEILDKAFTLIHNGMTVGVFQLEGDGMTSMMKRMKPTLFRHVVAGIALYRPGPMDYVDTFIDRMHGKEKVSYITPALRPILEDTYGIIVYQEQLMEIPRQLFGYTNAEADLIRRDVSKKKAESLSKHRQEFVKRGIERGYSVDVVNKIFDDYETFANYGFNKSHATDYAMLTMQTAVLKALYPEEFFTALLTVYRDKPDKMALIFDEINEWGIKIDKPNILKSDYDFTVHGNTILFGLNAVKGVSSKDVELIISLRNDNIKTIEEAIKARLFALNKKSLEAFIMVGAYDIIEPNRQKLMANAIALQSSKGLTNMFGDLDIELKDAKPNTYENSEWEKELLGVDLQKLNRPRLPRKTANFDAMRNKPTPFDVVIVNDHKYIGQRVLLGGEVMRVHTIHTKKGDEMAFVSITDYNDIGCGYETVFFPTEWKNSPVSEGDKIAFFAKIENRNGLLQAIFERLIQ